MSINSEHSGEVLHGIGLKLTIEGNYTDGLLAYNAAQAEYVGRGEDGLMLGHLARDKVRAYAGLSRTVLSDSGTKERIFAQLARGTLDDALLFHEHHDSNDLSGLYLTELVATLGVAARFALAQGNLDLAAGHWARAFGYIEDGACGNLDYTTQVTSHGAIALATFGERRHRSIARSAVRLGNVACNHGEGLLD
jgi:hypothetical protein